MRLRITVPVVAIVLCALPAAAAAQEPTMKGDFDLGVAAGDVKTRSAILWAHATKSGKVLVEVSRRRSFAGAEAATGLILAKSSNDNAVDVLARGLEPGTTYYYRFRGTKERSDRGRFQTAPASSKTQTIEFAYTGDYDAQPAEGKTKPFWNKFQIFKRMQNENNDFNIGLGDLIYSDTEVPGVSRDTDALSVKEKWAKYRMNLRQKRLSALRGAAGFYSQWDDHEFINDFGPSENEHRAGNPPNERIHKIDGRRLYLDGARAFLDYQPVRFTSKDGIYRSFRWGRNAELFFLDERSFRDAKASQGGTCDNPQTGNPDFAPTAPQDRRNFFSLLLPELAQPVSQACKDRINDKDRTFLGSRQFDRFTKALDKSKARFKIVINETPIQQFYVNLYDRWEGYEYERQRLLKAIADREVENVVFLTTDSHGTLVNEVRTKTLEQGGPTGTGMMEFIASPAATANIEQEFDAETGKPGLGRAADDLFLEPEPPDGVGMDCSIVDAFGYAQVRVRKSRMTITPKGLDGKPAKQEDGTACGPFTVKAK